MRNQTSNTGVEGSNVIVMRSIQPTNTNMGNDPYAEPMDFARYLGNRTRRAMVRKPITRRPRTGDWAIQGH